ncbi:MAG: hypothetical protein EHM50_04240 [Lysobacterales bacterium]|nr:MAG: hypothetical protein EHM50_04240 [Xanthomonadales bacterium]
MLWHKAWVDTRWRFLLGLTVLLVLACGSSFTFPRARDFFASMQLPVVADEEAAAAFRDQLELMRSFRGYVWSQWFSQSFPVLLTLVAALLGSGSPLVKGGSGALFSLALPVSRSRWIGTRAGTALAELFVLALAPSVVFVVLAPVVGAQFAATEAIAYGLSAFVGGSLFLGLAVFLSTLLNDVWRPFLLTCAGAVAIGVFVPYDHGLFRAMGGSSYFFSGTLAWPELLVSAAGAAGLVWAAAARIVRRDF